MAYIQKSKITGNYLVKKADGTTIKTYVDEKPAKKKLSEVNASKSSSAKKPANTKALDDTYNRIFKTSKQNSTPAPAPAKPQASSNAGRRVVRSSKPVVTSSSRPVARRQSSPAPKAQPKAQPKPQSKPAVNNGYQSGDKVEFEKPQAQQPKKQEAFMNMSHE